MKILLFFLLFCVIQNSSYIFKAKCPDEKTKTNACFFKNTVGEGANTKTEYLIFKKCGNGEKCDYEGKGICIDGEGLKKRKNGKSCNYNQDCLSGYCNSNKCGGLKKGDVCKSNEVRPEKPCDSGLVCKDDSSPGTKNEIRCIEPILTAGTKPEHTQCGDGLLVDPEGKCQKFGTIEDGEKTSNALLCKSGISHPKGGDANYDICDRIDTEPKCGEDESGAKKVITAGKWAKGGDIPVGSGGCKDDEDYNGKTIYYYQYSKVKSKLYEEFLEDYEDLDLEELNTKDKYAVYSSDYDDDPYSGYGPSGDDPLGGDDGDDGGRRLRRLSGDEEVSTAGLSAKVKWKTKKKYLLYDNAEELQAAGLIDSDGKVVSDKKCEYEFIMKNVLSSNNTKVGFLVLALFALLL